jgi:hypothetical protein
MMEFGVTTASRWVHDSPQLRMGRCASARHGWAVPRSGSGAELVPLLGQVSRVRWVKLYPLTWVGLDGLGTAG